MFKINNGPDARGPRFQRTLTDGDVRIDHREDVLCIHFYLIFIIILYNAAIKWYLIK